MNLLLEAAGAANATSAITMQVVIIALMFGFLYFFMIRPQKKRDKEQTNMRNSLEVGDEIITIGGIVGIVVSVKEDTLVIETGSDRSKIRISKWAVQSNLSSKEKVAEKPAEKTEKAETPEIKE